MSYNHTTKEATLQAAEYFAKLASKKQASSKAVQYMSKHISVSQLALYQNCGNYLVMLANDDQSKRKLETGFFCRQRLCPGCAWRSAVKAAETIACIAAAEQEEKQEMLFITLTIPNTTEYTLRSKIQQMGAAWSRLLKRSQYSQWINSIRKLEITYNAQSDTYHPHFHIIAFVGSSYFAGRNYISQKRLLQDWKEVMQDDRITQVDIRRCYENGKSNAILEVAKYSAKSSEFTLSEKVFDAYFRALQHTRTLTYSGRAKDLKKEYDCGRLANYAATDQTQYTLRIVYVWHAIANGYLPSEVSAYKPDEKPDKEADIGLARELRRVKFQHQLDTAWARCSWEDLELMQDE